jgi:GxxExxY protein
MDILLEPEEIYESIEKFPLKDETFKIIGACIEVHNQLGNGFLESVYKDALETEFGLQNISYEREKSYEIVYKGQKLKRKYIADFIIFETVVLEVKAQDFIVKANYAQTINYLKTSKNKVGLLVNFGEASLKFKRLIK